MTLVGVDHPGAVGLRRLVGTCARLELDRVGDLLQPDLGEEHLHAATPEIARRL